MTMKITTLAETSTAAITANDSHTFENYLWNDGEQVGFTFTRYWWKKGSVREGISPWVRTKLQPGEHPEFGRAARSEVLLPHDAPADYADIDYLLHRLDERLAPFAIHAMVQAKLVLKEEEEAWHVGYERVRSYARTHFAVRFPVILVAHVPALAGLAHPAHVHCIVPPRPLSINGLGGACNQLCSDRGHDAALAAWKDHISSDGGRP